MTERDENSAVSRSFQKIGTNITFKTALNGFSKEDVIFYVDKLQRDFAGQKKTLSDELDRLYSENNILTQKIFKHEATIEELANRLKKEYAKPDAFLAEREGYLKDIQALKETIVNLETELNEHKARANELTGSLNQAVYNSETAREQVKALSEKLFAANSQINQARQQLAAEYDRAEKLNQVMNYFKSQSEMFAARCSNMDQLSEQNRSLQGTIASVRQEIHAASADNIQLREQIKSLNFRVLEQQKKLEDQRAMFEQQRYEQQMQTSRQYYQPQQAYQTYQSAPQYSQTPYGNQYRQYVPTQQYSRPAAAPSYAYTQYSQQYQPQYQQNPAQRQYGQQMPYACGYNGR